MGISNIIRDGLEIMELKDLIQGMAWMMQVFNFLLIKIYVVDMDRERNGTIQAKQRDYNLL